MLRQLEAGQRPSVSTIILSKIAVALFVVFTIVCCCVQTNINGTLERPQMSRTTNKFAKLSSTRKNYKKLPM